ncbi:MAG: hypothetical protein O7C61_05550 [SAR324 cluster bacterium]|nr:hypothetical protein [SAR324 cluster bacterium]
MEDPAPLTIFLFSFSYRNSGAPEDEGGHGGGFVFDCRALPNPYWDEQLRPFSGRDEPIGEFMQRHSEVAEFAHHAAWLVMHAVRNYSERGYGRLMVAFGCTGGRHRSVYQAELLAGRLEQEGFRVVLRHRDIDNSPAPAPP